MQSTEFFQLVSLGHFLWDNSYQTHRTEKSPTAGYILLFGGNNYTTYNKKKHSEVQLSCIKHNNYCNICLKICDEVSYKTDICSTLDILYRLIFITETRST
jgi:hypothetical protein